MAYRSFYILIIYIHFIVNLKQVAYFCSRSEETTLILTFILFHFYR
jgi:hypothetical protein